MSRAYSSTPVSNLNEAELQQILLTCDGRGKEVKAEALNRLIKQTMRLKWTKEVPTHVGHYWIRGISACGVGMCGVIEVRFTDKIEKKDTIEWAGPLEMPEEPLGVAENVRPEAEQ